ncbi:SGNH/GDSL hydrolase family protein [Candidatus Fermentibacterales bacterium]|nr:SGNH/GDSL hydrolase family protein [Candidatus Fermentibacterales bacterium]
MGSRWANTQARKLSIVMLVAGAVMLLLALTSGLTGLSASEASSTGPIALGGLGIILLVSGITGRSFQQGYRNLALILLNTVVVMLLLELVAILAIRVFSPPLHRYDSTIRARSEGAAPPGLIFPSTSLQAYVMWRSDESSTPHMTILPGGERLTPGASPQPGAFEVFMYGGSTMWGWDVPDSSTIPARLQAHINGADMPPVRVRNLAQGGWVSTQSLVDLILRLRVGDVPDLVVFYDGANEVLSAFTCGVPGQPFAMDKLRAALESSDAGGSGNAPHLSSLLQASNLYLLLSNLLLPPPPEPTLVPERERLAALEPDLEALAGSTVALYTENLRVVQALGQYYGFEVQFYWQPVLCVGSRRPVGAESEILEAELPGLLELFSLTYERMQSESDSMPGLTCLTEAFADVDEELYTDICHVGERGNWIVATLIFDELAALAKLPASGQ